MPKKKPETQEVKLDGLPKLGPITLKKLQDAGVKTGFDIIIMGSQEISQVTGLKREDTDEIIEKTITLLTEEGKLKPMATREEIEAFQDAKIHLPCGCESLDEMLRGGVETQALTVPYGEGGAGKTQFIYSLAVETLAKGLGVYYLDCEGTYETKKVRDVATARGIEVDTTKLFVSKATDSYMIEKEIKKLPNIILQNNIKLIVVDGIVGIYRMEYDQGRGELNSRQNDIKYPIRHLKNIAEYLDVAVVCTNQVMGNPDGGWGADPIKMIGGHIFQHAPKYIIKFNKGGKNKRSASMKKSFQDPEYIVEFYLTDAGVTDPEHVNENGTLKKLKVPEFKPEAETVVDKTLLLDT